MALILVRVAIFLAVVGLLYSFGFFALLHRMARKTNVFKTEYKKLDKEFKK